MTEMRFLRTKTIMREYPLQISKVKVNIPEEYNSWHFF